MRLPKCFLPYFVALATKVKSPFALKEFWHISIFWSLYKLFSKVLVARFSRVMNDIKSKSAFFKGCNLVDGVKSINEVVEKLATWELFLDQLMRKLNSRGNKYVSLGAYFLPV